MFQINKIKNKEIFFISPHLDDAILSCGALIYSLKEQNNINIISIFTKPLVKKKYSKEAEIFLKKTGFSEFKKLFLKRKKEDEELFAYLKIGFFHLDFYEYIFISDRTSTNDYLINLSFNKKINNKLKKIINNENMLIFSPLGVGGNPDHLLVRDVINQNFKNVIFYEDYPYNLNFPPDEKFIKKYNLFIFEYKNNLFVKEKLINFYQSQIKLLFEDKPIVLKKERYYLKRINDF
jgi:LmbE family N-acetylglucosaminyl deacetylase